MKRAISRAGRKGVCPDCGSDNLRAVWIDRQDKACCLVCGWVDLPCKAQYPALRTDGRRVFAAVSYLNTLTGRGVSRREVANHLGISKNPRLIKVLGFHTNSGALCSWREASPLNGRETIVYAPWTASEKPQEARSAPEGTYDGKSYLKPPVATSKRHQYSRAAGHDWRDFQGE